MLAPVVVNVILTLGLFLGVIRLQCGSSTQLPQVIGVLLEVLFVNTNFLVTHE